MVIPGAARVGPEARPAAAIVNSPVRVLGCGWLVCNLQAWRKSVTKKRNEIFFAKAFDAEIWTRDRRRYLTSFAGLRFKNEPGLTELDAAECRRNTPLCVSKSSQWWKRYSDVIGQAIKIQSGRLFQHPPAAILNYQFAQSTLFFQISNTKKRIKNYSTSQVLLLSVRNLK